MADWPDEEFPNDSSRARYLFREHRHEWIAGGVVVRVGRQLVIIGPMYRAWLMKKADRVEGFSIPANERRSASRAA